MTLILVYQTTWTPPEPRPLVEFCVQVMVTRVFPKVDHSARSDRIVLIEYTTGFLLKICQRFGKDLTRFWQNVIEQMVNIYQIFGKVLFNHKLSLACFPGNEQDLGHKNRVNTYLFYQVCKVHDIVCFGDQYSNADNS